jgi:hypothetical protein
VGPSIVSLQSDSRKAEYLKKSRVNDRDSLFPSLPMRKRRAEARDSADGMQVGARAVLLHDAKKNFSAVS